VLAKLATIQCISDSDITELTTVQFSYCSHKLFGFQSATSTKSVLAKLATIRCISDSDITELTTV
jgi:hypothetical protein